MDGRELSRTADVASKQDWSRLQDFADKWADSAAFLDYVKFGGRAIPIRPENTKNP